MKVGSTTYKRKEYNITLTMNEKQSIRETIDIITDIYNYLRERMDWIEGEDFITFENLEDTKDILRSICEKKTLYFSGEEEEEEEEEEKEEKEEEEKEEEEEEEEEEEYTIWDYRKKY